MALARPLLLASILTLAAAGGPATWASQPAASVAGAPAPIPLPVYWDVGHGPWVGLDGEVYRPTGFYSKLSAAAADAGYDVTEGDAPLREAPFAGAAIVVVNVLSAHDAALTAADASALVAFVEAGGGLFILCENQAVAWGDHLAPLLDALGLSCSLMAVDNELTPTGGHATLAGVQRVTAAGAGEIAGEEFTPTLLAFGELVAAAKAVGDGRVVVVGDGNVVDDLRLGQTDNLRWALNSFSWMWAGDPRRQDADGDGFTALPGPLPGGDCDEGDPDAHPGAPEILGSGADEDCDGEVDEATPSPQPTPSPTAEPTPETRPSPLLMTPSPTQGTTPPGPTAPQSPTPPPPSAPATGTPTPAPTDLASQMVLTPTEPASVSGGGACGCASSPRAAIPPALLLGLLGAASRRRLSRRPPKSP